MPMVDRQIVLIEDDDDSRVMLASLLRAFGFAVEVANDGPSGLAAIQELAPKVALIDIGLPGMSGLELGHRLRVAHPPAPACLIALTGYSQERDRQAIYDAGFDHLFVKPIDVPALERVLSEAIAAN